MTNFHDVRLPLHLGFGTRGGPVRSVDILQMADAIADANIMPSQG